MSFMDDLRQGKMGDVGNMRQRYEELKHQEEVGEIDEAGCAELDKLRAHFENL